MANMTLNADHEMREGTMPERYMRLFDEAALWISHREYHEEYVLMLGEETSEAVSPTRKYSFLCRIKSVLRQSPSNITSHGKKRVNMLTLKFVQEIRDLNEENCLKAAIRRDPTLN
ncbi:hypothetical protein AB6A40_010265 [Gnathostoma spinigerum]|uniref:Uncharacterized protein n=1 Tax=Gnathostoma spinigerum TaxID=75299 RepID=A0ABD6EUL9_9BILA